MRLADWIMRVATDDPPRGREHWVQAMRAEYASLASGKLGWALGCWTTMLGWRLRADAAYLFALITTVAILYFSPVGRWLHGSVYAATSALDLSPNLILMFMAAAVLSTLRPARALVTGIALIAMQSLHWVVNDWYVHIRWPHVHAVESGQVFLYSAPPNVGHLAEIGACAAGAILGTWIAGLWRRRLSVVASL